MQQMPPGAYRYKAEPQFLRKWDDPEKKAWYILGAEDKLPVGKIVEVNRYNEGPCFVEILAVVARRCVKTRDGQSVFYVLCTFDNIVEEPKTEA